jgi:hypothetical protein
MLVIIVSLVQVHQPQLMAPLVSSHLVYCLLGASSPTPVDGTTGKFSFGFRQITREHLLRFTYKFVCGLRSTRERFLSKTSATENPRWPPGGHLGFCIPACNASMDWQIDLDIFFVPNVFPFYLVQEMSARLASTAPVAVPTVRSAHQAPTTTRLAPWMRWTASTVPSGNTVEDMAMFTQQGHVLLGITAQ